MNVATQWHGFLPFQNWKAILRAFNSTALDLRNRASCGLFALHHAMVFLGQGQNFELLRSLKTKPFQLIFRGTEAWELRDLARRYGFKSALHSSWCLEQTRRVVDDALGAGQAVIIGSEPQCHWIALGGRTHRGGYVWADSSADPAVGAFSCWGELENWLSQEVSTGCSAKLEHPFEILTIAPSARMPASRSMVPYIGSLWRHFVRDPAYAMEWGNLLADMLEVFWDADYAPEGHSAGPFLDEHLSAIVQAVARQTGKEKGFLRNLGLCYRDAAEFHSLVVPEGEETVVVAAFTLKLVAKAGHL